MSFHHRGLRDPEQRPGLRDTAARLYTEGASIRGVADRMGCSYTGVRNLLLEAGVKIRAANGQQKPTGP